MSKLNTLLNMPKKPASDLSQDWHAIDVVAAVRKSGSSLTRLSRLNGLSSTVVGQCLYKPYPKCERIIAEFLCVSVQTIWPSRYNQDGTPKSGRGERGLGRHLSRLKAKPTSKCNDTPADNSRNVYALDKAAA